MSRVISDDILKIQKTCIFGRKRLKELQNIQKYIKAAKTHTIKK